MLMRIMVKTCFWYITNSGEILNKFEFEDFLASSLSTYDVSNLYATLPPDLKKNSPN